MTIEQKEHFKQIIDEQIQALSKEMKLMKNAVYPERGQGSSDKVAHISFKQEQNIHIQRLAEATKRINSLKYAYLKTNTPEYGICKECEEEISLERLNLMPESLYCVDCMNEFGI